MRNGRPGMDINAIQAELQEFAGQQKVKVKADRALERAVSLRETDQGYTVAFNPGRIRSQRLWELHLEWVRKVISGG